jgi:hypothetical protein
MIEWLRAGNWVLNTGDVSAVYFEDTPPEGPKIEIFTRSGGQPSPRHPLLWWGMNSTLSRRHQLDQRSGPHGAL